MNKILVFLIALSLLWPILFCCPSTRVTACPVRMPQTLLTLYRNSDTIYIARYNGADVGETKVASDRFDVVETMRHFDVSTVLKGSAVKEFTLFDDEYRFKGRVGFETLEEVDAAQTVAEVDISAEEVMEEDMSAEVKPGDIVMLFLRKGETGERLELAGGIDGQKKLAAPVMALYEARVKDLNQIFKAKKPDPEKIVDWLVLCAEEPATRWEGTFELERSFSMRDYQKSREAERKQVIDGEAIEADSEFEPDEFETGDKSFAEILNPHHKQSLTAILLNSEFRSPQKRPGQRGLIRGDDELLRLVSRWADSQVTAMLVNQLRSGAYTTSEMSSLMDTIAATLGDKTLGIIAKSFDNAVYEREDAVVQEPEAEESYDVSTDDEALPAAESDKSPEPTQESSKPEKSDEAKNVKPAETEQVRPAITYKQFRANLLSRFLARFDELMINPGTPSPEK